MPKERTKNGEKSVNKEQIKKKLESFKTTSSKIEYLQSIVNKEELMPISNKKVYYEILGDLYLKKEDLKNAAINYDNAGIEDKARLLWKSQGKVQMAYRQPYSARTSFHKAGAKEEEKDAVRKQINMTLENSLNVVIAFGAFLCSFIFLSGSITGNTILNSSFKTSNILGSLLFIIGIVVSFIYLEKRKRK
jgi:hypothetical protein